MNALEKAAKLVLAALALLVAIAMAPSVIAGLGWFWTAALLYAVPSVIAMARKHRSDLAIGATNLLLGWTVVGWVVALIWSLTGNTRQLHTDGSWR